MAELIYTRKELKEILNVKSAYITTYIKRGKLVPKDQKGQKFDLSNPTNRDFIEKRTSITHPGQDQSAEAETEEFEDIKDILEPPKNLTAREIEKWKKRLEAAHVREKAEVARLQKEKLLGKNLPYEMVEPMITSLVKNYTDEFKEAAETIVEEFAAISGISTDEQASMKNKLIQGLNEAGKRANKEARKDLKYIVKQVQKQREAGEQVTPNRNSTT